MLYESKIQGFVREATFNFIGDYRSHFIAGRQYQIICQFKVLPMNHIFCLDMILSENEQEIKNDSPRQKAIMVDVDLLN